jgi:membrane protease subunit (stomatin/prohibitin family)
VSAFRRTVGRLKPATTVTLWHNGRAFFTEEASMGLMDFARSQLIEIIDWPDAPRDMLSYRFPDEDREIKRGAQLVVRESQAAQFVYLGQFAETFGPGTFTLTTDNIPVLTRLRGWKYGFESPFKADVYFVRTRLFTGNKWGTANPVMMHDPDAGVVRLRAFGTYDFRVVDVRKFLRDVVGTDTQFTVEEFADVMRSRIVSAFSNAVVAAKIGALDVAGRYKELGDALLPVINPILKGAYGLEMTAFVIENVSVPPEVEKAMDTRGTLQTIGNLNDYVKLQVAQAFGHGGAGLGGGTPIGAFGAEMAAGLVMAQQVLKQTGAIVSPGDAAPASAPGIPETLGPPRPPRRSA